MRACVGFSIAKGLGGLLSRVIRWFDGSKASHAWILYRDQELGTLMVMEAHQTGFRTIPFAAFQEHSNVIRVVIPSIEIDMGLPEGAKLLGEHYDFAGLVGMLFVLLGRRLRKRWKNPLRSAKSQFCTEAVARILQAARYPGLEGVDPEDCDVKQLMDLFEADGSREWVQEE